ncbi:MAG TPA: prepilin-type N-terminal cleavage/methylation domain-containing protein [Bryobacteraceae bacterium]|nr:prepilin-type N-terminal cleavage/methylation domain-containing protein [Bryobacteraceae bacterium]
MKLTRRGFSLLELLIVIAVILVLMTVAIPGILSTHLGSVETAVAREVQTIGQVELQYSSQFGKYAGTLAELGPPASGAVSSAAAGLIPASLASGEKNGYVFALALIPGGYTVNANPKVFGKTGRRTFYLDQDGIVHQNWGPEPATASSPELK